MYFVFVLFGMAINVSVLVEYNGGFLPDMVLLTQCTSNPSRCHIAHQLDTISSSFCRVSG